MNTEQFKSMLEEKGITLTSLQLEQYEQYFQTLVEWNEKMNLTAITEKSEVYLKHFFDSISASFYFDFTKPIEGVGCIYLIPSKVYKHAKYEPCEGYTEHRPIMLKAKELGISIQCRFDTIAYHADLGRYGMRWQ